MFVILIRRFSLIHQETFEVFFQVISVGVQGEKRTDSMSFLIAQLQAKTEWLQIGKLLTFLITDPYRTRLTIRLATLLMWILKVGQFSYCEYFLYLRTLGLFVSCIWVSKLMYICIFCVSHTCLNVSSLSVM